MRAAITGRLGYYPGEENGFLPTVFDLEKIKPDPDAALRFVIAWYPPRFS